MTQGGYKVNLFLEAPPSAEETVSDEVRRRWVIS